MIKIDNFLALKVSERAIIIFQASYFGMSMKFQGRNPVSPNPVNQKNCDRLERKYTFICLKFYWRWLQQSDMAAGRP